MHAKSSSMELSDPATPDTSLDLNGTTNRRKSGRARQKPVLLNKDPNVSQVSSGSSAKRKLADLRGIGEEDFSDVDSGDETSPEESDPDEEELKEQRKKASRAKKALTKSAPKRAKTGPALTTKLAVRPAVNRVKKPSKSQKPRARPAKNVADDGTGLYG